MSEGMPEGMTAGGISLAPAPMQESSLQADLARIESLVTEAHVRVSTMAPTEDDKQPTEANDRAGVTAGRCIDSLDRLVSRLTVLAERVGSI